MWLCSCAVKNPLNLGFFLSTGLEVGGELIMLILWILFYLFCFVFIGLILLQQSKGDVGFMGGSQSAFTQQVFGGSGGLEVFEKITWAMGAIFFLSCLMITYYQSKDSMVSVLDRYKETVYLDRK